jgi:hypothetical protein
MYLPLFIVRPIFGWLYRLNRYQEGSRATGCVSLPMIFLT